MTTTAERSIRLNQSHRADMANAVMKGWEKQNPPPAQADHIALLEAIAPQLKKHAAHKRTVRMVNALEPDDFKHVRREYGVNVAVINKQGETRNTLRVGFPKSIADRLGVTGLPGILKTMYSDEFAPNDLDPSEIEDFEDLDTKKLGVKQRLLVKFITFAEADFPTVQLDDKSPQMQARANQRSARHEWEQKRETLGRETRDLLENFNTTKQLREGWPDIVPYLPPHIADTRGINLPVLETSRLSERLGISS